MDFKASLDGFAKGITIAITILFAVILGSIFSTTSTDGLAPKIFIGGLLLATYAICYALSPKKYSIEGENLIIHRLFSNVSVPLTHIKATAIAENISMVNTFRTFGVGGLFGYFGKFYNASMGNMDWYVTNRKKMVVLLLDTQKKIVVSPEEQDIFIGQLNP